MVQQAVDELGAGANVDGGWQHRHQECVALAEVVVEVPFPCHGGSIDDGTVHAIGQPIAPSLRLVHRSAALRDELDLGMALFALLHPLLGGALGILIHQRDAPALAGVGHRQIGGDGGLPTPALGVDDQYPRRLRHAHTVPLCIICWQLYAHQPLQASRFCVAFVAGWRQILALLFCEGGFSLARGRPLALPEANGGVGVIGAGARRRPPGCGRRFPGPSFSCEGPAPRAPRGERAWPA